MASFTSIAATREYLNNVPNSGSYTDGIIGSNIVVASAAIERMTNRQFAVQSNTKVFTTYGRQNINIPDLISASAVTLNSAALTQDSGFYLIPDVQQSGVFTAINLTAYRAPFDYRSYPDWFDKNYDSPRFAQQLRSGIPNDLSITGIWGHAPIPDDIIKATAILAAWLTKRPDAVLGNTIQTPEGNVFDLSRIPGDASVLLEPWKIELDAAVSL